MFSHLNLGRQTEYVSPFKAVLISKIIEEKAPPVDYNQPPVAIPIAQSSRMQYLPGEKLLKTINGNLKKKKQKNIVVVEKLKPKDIERIRKSISKLTMLYTGV